MKEFKRSLGFVVGPKTSGGKIERQQRHRNVVDSVFISVYIYRKDCTQEVNQMKVKKGSKKKIIDER
ncbi:MAG: hypothetical protein V4613_07010 [Bacteroidota bacterium]